MSSFVGVTNTGLNVTYTGLTLEIERSQLEQAGDVMLCFVTSLRFGSPAHVITPPAGWTLVSDTDVVYVRDGTSENFRSEVYVRAFVAGDPAGYVFTRSGQDGGTFMGVIVVYRPGADEAVRAAGVATDTSFGITVDAPSVDAAAESGSRLVVAYQCRGVSTPNTIDPHAGLTERFDAREAGNAMLIEVADTEVLTGATGVKTGTRTHENIMGAGQSIMLEGLPPPPPAPPPAPVSPSGSWRRRRRAPVRKLSVEGAGEGGLTVGAAGRVSVAVTVTRG